jgi:hypothetical protein
LDSVTSSACAIDAITSLLDGRDIVRNLRKIVRILRMITRSDRYDQVPALVGGQEPLPLLPVLLTQPRALLDGKCRDKSLAIIRTTRRDLTRSDRYDQVPALVGGQEPLPLLPVLLTQPRAC